MCVQYKTRLSGVHDGPWYTVTYHDGEIEIGVNAAHITAAKSKILDKSPEETKKRHKKNP